MAFVRGVHRSPVNSPHKSPVTGKMLLHWHSINRVIISMVVNDMEKMTEFEATLNDMGKID